MHSFSKVTAVVTGMHILVCGKEHPQMTIAAIGTRSVRDMEAGGVREDLINNEDHIVIRTGTL